MLAYFLGGLITLHAVLRTAAKPIAARWPGSLPDVAIASMLEILPGAIAFLQRAVTKKGTAAPLVPPSDALPLGEQAKKMYEEFAAALKWVGVDGRVLPPWDDLKAAERVAWSAAAAFARRTGAPASIPPRRPPTTILPLVLLLALGCAGNEGLKPEEIQEAIDVSADVASVGGACLLVAYEQELTKCAGVEACRTEVKTRWAPIIEQSDRAHRVWCKLAPEGKGCAK